MESMSRIFHPDQLQTIAVLQKQIESLEDQVIDRDVALQEIESQMKQDYEQHDQLIRKRNREVWYRYTVEPPSNTHSGDEH